MVWSLVVSAIVLTVVRGWQFIRAMPLRVWGLVLAGAALIAVNWGIYIWAVNNDRVVDAALGYFINPLVTVLFGVLIFKERLRVAPVGGGRARRHRGDRAGGGRRHLAVDRAEPGGIASPATGW